MRFLFVFVFLSSVAFGQKGNFYGHPSDASAICEIRANASRSFTSQKEGENILDRIIDVTGISKRFVLYECNEINNCEALIFRGIRYIFYNSDFMKEISNKTGNSWANTSILAHEIGHHVNGHTLDWLSLASGEIKPSSLKEIREQELEADEFSGFVMYKLGATLNQAKKAINIYGFDGDDTYSTHPNKTRRLNAIERGYNKAKSVAKKMNSVQIKKEYYESTEGKPLKSELRYKNGELDGVQKKYYYTGSLDSRAYYKDGKLHGLSQKWDYSGQILLERNWKNGKKFGLERVWWDDGTLRSVTIMNERGGSIEYLSKYFWPNGQISHEVIIQDSTSEYVIGKTKHYHENGQLEEEGLCKYIEGRNSKDGKQLKIGRWKYWYENGQLWGDSYYNKKSNLDGESKQWYENGQLKNIRNYKDGIKINEILYDEKGNLLKKD